MRRVAVAGLGMAVAGILTWTAGANAPAAHQVLDRDAQPLRRQFDADSGKMRAIFLASPT